MNKYIFILFLIIPLKLTSGEALIYEKKLHADSIDSLCINDKEIISASFDGNINKTNNKETKIIGKHKDWVRKVICTGSNIISASNDGTISIWSDSKKIKSVRAHSWWVTDIALSGNKLVSVSLDETVKVWSYPELELLYSHKIYGSNKHYTVMVDSGRAFVGSTLGTMNVLDMKTYKWLREKQRLLSTYSISQSMTKSKEAIFFGSSDGFITKINSNSLRIKRQRRISSFSLKAVSYSQGYLYVGDSGGVLRKINPNNLKELYVISQYPEAVQAVAIDDNYIYAGYNKGYIRIFINKNDITK